MDAGARDANAGWPNLTTRLYYCDEVGERLCWPLPPLSCSSCPKPKRRALLSDPMDFFSTGPPLLYLALPRRTCPGEGGIQYVCIYNPAGTWSSTFHAWIHRSIYGSIHAWIYHISVDDVHRGIRPLERHPDRAFDEPCTGISSLVAKLGQSGRLRQKRFRYVADRPADIAAVSLGQRPVFYLFY